jgi:hypothetical protein
VGEPQLNFYHAILTVLVRRDVMKETALGHFWSMWDAEADCLLHNLSSRWLISACDTIVDYHADSYERAIACLGSTLMNTIKLYETERLCNGDPRSFVGDLSSPKPLFDGMTSFSVGHGDMIQSLRNRTKSVCRPESLASKILTELLNRADRFDTIYRRFAQLHRNDATRWSQA